MADLAHFHAAVWIDHRTAEVYGLGHDAVSHVLVKSHGPHRIHHKAGTVGSGHLHDKPDYFRQVAAALAGAREIVVFGPAETKTEFKSFLDAHDPALAARVLAVEPMDRQSEGEIIDSARRFFKHADHMTPQRA